MTKQTKNRRTKEQMSEHISYAKQLLDLDIPPYAVALQLQQRFGLCRSSAWRDVRYANEERGKEGVHASAQPYELRDTLVRVLFQSVLTASADGDVNMIPRLSKEIRELLKMGGPGAGRHPYDGMPDQDSTLTQIENMYRRSSGNAPVGFDS